MENTSENIDKESIEKFTTLAEQLRDTDPLKFNRFLGRMEGLIESQESN